MKSAKIVSFIAFVYNIFLTFVLFRVFSEISLTFQELEIQTPSPWPLFGPPILAIIGFGYWFYLKRKDNKGESVRFALWISLALLFIPGFIIFLLSPSNYFQPLHQLLEAIGSNIVP